MKKNRLISLLILFALAIGLILPVLAAEGPYTDSGVTIVPASAAKAAVLEVGEPTKIASTASLLRCENGETAPAPA